MGIAFMPANGSVTKGSWKCSRYNFSNGHESTNHSYELFRTHNYEKNGYLVFEVLMWYDSEQSFNVSCSKTYGNLKC